ncbi:MAG: hypothetical protein PWP64_936 [Candidatus Cloacimonadota bacterium]|nr:hypothetical protein [Candidatus Cloacimonadota bacterium]
MRYPLCVIRYALFVIRYPLSVIRYGRSEGLTQISLISQIFFIWRGYALSVIRYTLYVIRYASYSKFRASNKFNNNGMAKGRR